MASSDPFLPVERGEQPETESTEAELEADRAESLDPEGDGPTDEGLPPMPSTPFQRPDGEAVDPAGL